MSLNNLRIVLVRPQYSGNIGAVARAMRNMGITDLALVNPARLHREQAEMMAVHARDVLDAMHVHASLRAAVGDCGLVVGTTCRSGLYRDHALSPRTLAPDIVIATGATRVALVFGPEESGLTNEDLRICHRLMTIPTDAAYPSLNIAQAVLLCCYEVFLAARERTPALERSLALAEQQELMYEKLKRALLHIGFLHKDNPEHIMFALRRILGRAGLEERDVRILLGMARQIEWYAKEGWRHAQPKADGENVKI
ncbi:MAG TPA: RNA methyltransferase [Methylomirabilota bacterium]|jgi:tRNA/rRNA methyltransferase|nr:RNA methyltransferase [Methylomirabilota bacterium]